MGSSRHLGSTHQDAQNFLQLACRHYEHQLAHDQANELFAYQAREDFNTRVSMHSDMASLPY